MDPQGTPVFTPRPIRSEQAESARALIARCYREYGLTLNLNDECESHLLHPGEHFRELGGDYWVLVDDAGDVRATCALAIATEGPTRTAELKSMYVDPMWRRRGIGRMMTLHVVEQARRRGCPSIELWSDTRFEAAHRMYESLGFERHGRRTLDDSNKSAEWGYRLDL